MKANPEPETLESPQREALSITTKGLLAALMLAWKAVVVFIVRSWKRRQTVKGLTPSQKEILRKVEAGKDLGWINGDLILLQEGEVVRSAMAPPGKIQIGEAGTNFFLAPWFVRRLRKNPRILD